MNTTVVVKKTRNRRRQAGNQSAGNTVVVGNPNPVSTGTVVIANSNARTARNRRRRQRRRQRAIQGITQPVISRQRRTILDSFTLIESLTMRKSVHDLLQNLFVPTHGLHRGTAVGTELTALTRFKQSEVVTVPSNTAVTYCFMPDNITSDNRFAAYVRSPTANTMVINPFDASPPSGSIQEFIPGPFFGTNPSTDAWRVVSFQLKIINITAAISAAGAHVPAYHPRIMNQFGGIDTAVFTNFNSIDQLEWSVPVPSETSMIINWVPNSAETLVTADNIPNSGVLGYITSGTNNAQFRFEWDIGIEYTPNVGYRPYVDRISPDIHPDAWFYVNKELTKHWDSWVISPYNLYLKRIEGLESLNPTVVSYNKLSRMGSYGTGGVIADGDLYDEYEEAKGSNWQNVADKASNIVRKVVGAATNAYCAVNPESVVCDPIVASLGQTPMGALGL